MAETRPPEAALGSPVKPTEPRLRRDLSRARYLRAADVFALYGIPRSTLDRLARLTDRTRRAPSLMISAAKGRKGIRLYPREEFDAWVRQFRSE